MAFIKKAFALFAVLVSAPSFASIQIISDNRFIRADTPGTCLEFDEYTYSCSRYSSRIETLRQPSGSGGDFQDSWWGYEAGTSQSSSIDSHSMSGEGRVYAGDDAIWSYGMDPDSVFAVTFTVSEDLSFNLMGSLDDGGWYSWQPPLAASLSENGHVIFEQANSDFNINGMFYEGVEYELFLSAKIYDSTNYEYIGWEFNLATAAVPLPAGVWLMLSALGIAGFGYRQNRK